MESKNQQTQLPGEEITLTEDSLFAMLGRKQAALELEQSKRLALAQAYNALVRSLEVKEVKDSV